VACGDVDRDGVDQIAITNFSQSQCWIKVYEFNKQRTVLSNFRIFPTSFEGGCTVSLGDVDGDRIDEIIVGSGQGTRSHVEVWEAWGKKKEIDFWPFHPGYTNGVDVASGDVRGNGDDEIVVSQRSNAEAWVKVYDYRSTKDIVSEFKAYGNYTCGANVEASDLNGDGKTEIITGAGEGGGPHIRGFTTQGESLFGFFAYNKGFRGGSDMGVGIFNK